MNLEGIDYTAHDWSVTGKRKRRKPTRAELERTYDACMRARDVSDHLRRMASAESETQLEPLPETYYEKALRERLGY